MWKVDGFIAQHCDSVTALVSGHQRKIGHKQVSIFSTNKGILILTNPTRSPNCTWEYTYLYILIFHYIYRYIIFYIDFVSSQKRSKCHNEVDPFFSRPLLKIRKAANSKCRITSYRVFLVRLSQPNHVLEKNRAAFKSAWEGEY